MLLARMSRVQEHKRRDRQYAEYDKNSYRVTHGLFCRYIGRLDQHAALLGVLRVLGG